MRRDDHAIRKRVRIPGGCNPEHLAGGVAAVC